MGKLLRISPPYQLFDDCEILLVLAFFDSLVHLSAFNQDALCFLALINTN